MRNKKYTGKDKIGYLLFVSFMLICMNAFAIEIKDMDFGFKLTLPDGFENFPQGMNRPNAIYSYARYSQDGIPTIIVGIERMHGTIGKEPLILETVRKMLPPGYIVKQYQDEWSGFQVNGIEAIVTQGSVTMVEKSVEIPLRLEAIQIVVLGPETDAEEISQVMKQILYSLEGESNW